MVKGARVAVPLYDFSFADIIAKKSDASFTDGPLPGANFPEHEAILSSKAPATRWQAPFLFTCGDG